MSKVYGIHEIVLHPGVDEASFEQFCKESFYEAEGWKYTLLKGDRGQRAGKYAVLIEVESVETRDLSAPKANVQSDEVKRFNEEHKAEQEIWYKKWFSFTTTDLRLHPE
jgi:hypothetical protein